MIGHRIVDVKCTCAARLGRGASGLMASRDGVALCENAGSVGVSSNEASLCRAYTQSKFHYSPARV
jgi:hypothetical protein